MAKRLMCLFLALVTVFSLCVPGFASDEQEDGAALDAGEVQVEGNNSVGELIANELNTQTAAKNAAGNGITGLTVEGNTATVTFKIGAAADLVVAIYNETSGQMVASGTTRVSAGATSAAVAISGSIPATFIATAFLLDAASHEPLCDDYTTEFYTKAVQDFENTTVEDFDEDQVLNLDSSPDTNFMVFNDETLKVSHSGQMNMLTKTSETTYEITGADAAVKALAAGDTFYYEMSDGTPLAIKVLSAETSGSTVTITQDTNVDWSDFFDCVKIDLGNPNGDVAPAAEIYDNSRDPVKLIKSFNKEKTISGSLGSATISANGSAEANLVVKVYFSIWGEKYAQVSVDLKAEAHFKATGEISRQKLELPSFNFDLLGGCVGVSFTPELVFQASGEIAFDAVVAAGFGVRADGNGLHDISKEPTFDARFEAQVVVYVGIVLTPSISVQVPVVRTVVARCSLPVEVGVEITASSFWSNEQGDSVHECGAACIDCNVSAKLKISITGKLLSWEGTMDLLPTKTFDLADFYYSIKYNEFGMGDCPHVSYKVTLTAVDATGAPVAGARFRGTSQSGTSIAPIADSTGVVVIYLPNGTYDLTVKSEDATIGGSLTLTVADRAVSKTVTLTPAGGDLSTGTLSGLICKASDRSTPVGGATISVYAGNDLYTVLTADDGGNYSASLPVGVYYIRITAPGYILFTGYATVAEDDITYMETFLLVEGEESETGVACGSIIDSLTGDGIEGVTLSARSGWNNTTTGDILATATTDSYGDYEITLPLGNYTLAAVKDGYVSSSVNIVVQLETTYNQNGVMNPQADGQTLLVVLTWGEYPEDLDSHLVCITDPYYHIYFSEMSFYQDELVANLDVDDTNGEGPERSTVYQLNPTDKFSFYVHDYTNRYSDDSYEMSQSGAKVRVYLGNQLIASYNVPTNRAGTLWHVFDYNASTSTVTPVNEFSYHSEPATVGPGSGLSTMIANVLPAPEKPSASGEPEVTAEPTPESTPEVTAEPEITTEPSTEPEPTPEVTVEPGATEEPEVTVEPEATTGPTVEPEATPEVTTEPMPEVTAEPAPVATAEPAPEVTAEPTPEVTAEPTPEVTAEPTPEVTAEPTPEVTAEPAPVATAEPTPEETSLPEEENDTLLEELEEEGVEPVDASQEQSETGIELAAAYTGSVENQTALFTGLKPGADYVVLAMVNASAAQLLAADNLLFIAQVAADSKGNIALAYVPRVNSAAQVRAFGPTDQLETPKVSISMASNGIKVTWNKVNGSPRYMVYYRENGGKWTRIGTTTKTSYTRAASKLKDGVTYSFTVRCCQNDKKTMLSPYQASNSLKYYAAPKVKIALASNGIKVTWNKVNGSPRYMVYYKENGGSWKKIGTTTSTSYTRAASKLKDGVTYSFTVRCCQNDKKTMLSPYQASNSLKYYAAPKATISVTATGGIKVSWNKVAGVPRYMVYYRENGGSWKKIGTTTATSYTRAASKLETGVNYQFTVRCCANDKKTMLSPYQASNSLDHLAAPKATIAKAANGIKVSWSKVSGASRYMVYYRENGGSWKKIGTTTSTSYTRAASKLKNGVNYQFTVRCVMNDKKTMVSGYAASNSLKHTK